MVNWDLLSPRNLILIAVLALIAIYAFNYFHGKSAPAVAPAQ